MIEFLDRLIKALEWLEKADSIQENSDFHICNLDFTIEKLEEYVFRTKLRIKKEGIE